MFSLNKSFILSFLDLEIFANILQKLTSWLGAFNPKEAGAGRPAPARGVGGQTLHELEG